MSAKGEAARARVWGEGLTERLYHPQHHRRASSSTSSPKGETVRRSRRGRRARSTAAAGVGIIDWALRPVLGRRRRRGGRR